MSITVGPCSRNYSTEFSTSILITRETLDKINGKIETRNHGEVKVKGRDKPVEVFEVLIPGKTKQATEEVS